MSDARQTHRLTIVIPALNEEEAIGGTIERTLAARETIKRGGVDDIEVVVVSDGSTDRTPEIARGFAEVKTIVFEKNRGYGAAIKEGFRQGSGDLVGFLDADGTCDPVFFEPMCRATLDGAHVALGSRLGPETKMPPIRRLGNRIFALILGVLCGRSVSDTASGMRVIRRSSLDDLYPLPDGLHFTPAMSARALLNGLNVAEIPMTYEERIGESKLRVVKDGLRFLRVIIEGVLCYRPERLFLMAFTLCLVLSLALGIYPIEFYAANRRLEEWMIYRFLVCFLAGAVGLLSLSAGVLAYSMASLGPERRGSESFWPPALAHLFRGWPLATMIIVSTIGSIWLVWPGIVEYVSTRHVTLHWSRVIVSAFGLFFAFQSFLTWVLLEVIDIWKAQHADRAKRQAGGAP